MKILREFRSGLINFITYLLVHSVVTSDGTVGSLGFDGLAVRANQDGGHHTLKKSWLRSAARSSLSRQMWLTKEPKP